MSEAVLSVDGQIPIPEDVRDQMGSRPGDRVQLRVVDDRTLVVERQVGTPARQLFGMVKLDRPLTLEDMERAIEEGPTRR